jgi:hypothetical protein
MNNYASQPGSPLRQQQDLNRDDTVIRRKPVASVADTESLLSYRTSLDGSDGERSETF